MKELKLTVLILLLSVGINAQDIDVENSNNQMSNVTLDINKPINCNTDFDHRDNLSLPKDKEKQKNINANSTYARSLRFKLKFKNNCVYNLGNSNQLDWNKVMAIHQTNDGALFENTFNNMRVGWRWNLTKNLMELGFYAHIKHTTNNNPGREFFYLCDVSLETFYNTELILGNGGLGIIVGDVGGYIKRRDIFENDKVKTAFFKSAYFGGQECPPHKVAMRVENIKGDKNKTNWHGGTCEKTFARSIFYSGENLDVSAARKITLSQQVYRGQYDAGSTVAFNNNIPAGFSSGDEIPWFESDGERFVKVESGTVLVMRAGEEIVFLSGFVAELGSDFTAKIDPAISCESFNFRPSGLDDNDSLLSNSEEIQSTNEVADDFISVKIFPNPTTNSFTYQSNVNIQNSIFKITNVLNQTVYTKTVNDETTDVNFDISDLAKGIYFLNLYSAEGKLLSSKKIIKQ